MHLLDDGTFALSPSDLTGFAACEHLTQLELSAARGERERPKRDDPMLDVLSTRGEEHETEHVERLVAEGKTVVEIAMPGNTVAALAAAEAETLAAMRAGADVIYQATFFDGRWRGHADFLLKVERPSPHLGAWSYEVADTKLARRVKAAALLQMCAYSEQVERLQGVAPERMYVITGDAEVHPFTLTDYSAYYRTLKARFVALIDGPNLATYPDPVEHCGICRWGDECKDRRRADDHLSLVSGMRRDQTRKLTDVGIATRHDLAALPAGTTVSGMAEMSVERLRHQAELQVRGEGHAAPDLRAAPARAARSPVDPDCHLAEAGMGALPEPSPGDLYFDMEGDPFAIDDDHGSGLEYLFGVSWIGATASPSTARFWAHTRAEEKPAFEAFVDFVHGAPGRAPRPARVPLRALRDDRGQAAHGRRTTPARPRSTSCCAARCSSTSTRSCARRCASAAESYSLKQVEHLYLDRARRRGDERRPTASSRTRPTSTTASQAPLDDIERYNEDDCRSTLELHRWLEAQRADADAQFGEIPRLEVRDGTRPRRSANAKRSSPSLSAQLLGRTHPTTSSRPRWLLAQMLDWHRREAKPDWWMYFARRHMSDDELFDDRECISGLEYVGDVAR